MSTTPFESNLIPLARRGAKWIWDDKSFLPNRYVWLRRTFEQPAKVDSATLRITVEGHYECWVNGERLGQGPVPYRNPWLPVDSYELTALLQPGRNVVAVLVHSYGILTHTSSTQEVGLIAELELTKDSKTSRLVSDGAWKVSSADGWLSHGRRRSWATGFAEDFDGGSEGYHAADLEFDDSGWPAATIRPATGVKFFPRPTPILREDFLPARTLLSATKVSCDTNRPDQVSLTAWLDTEPAKPVAASMLSKLKAGTPIRLPASSSGVALTFDLGDEWSGQIEFEVEAPAGTVIEGAGAERLIDGRSTAAFKDADYAFRYHTREGWQSWRQFTYNGLRYLHLVVRATTGPVIFHRIGLWRRQAKLDVRGTFECSDPLWNQLYQVSLQTLLVSTQEVQVDCPTREQAPYFGDAVWTGLWAAWLTGDISYLRHLIFLGRTCQEKTGLLMGSPLTGLGAGHVMFDYSLIWVWGVRVLYDYARDKEEVRISLPAIEKLLRWFLRKLDGDGMLKLEVEESRIAGTGLLFLDHNGLGWHIQNEPGIERRGQNAGLHFLLLNALETYLSLCRIVSATPKLPVDTSLIRKLRQQYRKAFWNPKIGLFSDARMDGKLSPTLSEQTNTLAVLFGIAPRSQARQILERVLSYSAHPIARCSPYFMIYLADAMLAAGMQSECVKLVAARWKPMLDAGATTWWETFAGDHLDTFCHPWSSLPLALAFKGILGIRPVGRSSEITPLRKEFASAKGRMLFLNREVSVEWKKGGKLIASF